MYEKQKGRKIGEVYDLSISEKGIVIGLLLRKGAIFKKNYLIPIKDVASFGWDGIMIDDAPLLSMQNKQADYTVEGQQKLLGKPILSSEGEKLGLLEDVYFQEEVGTIVGYECSDGFFSDITEGKRVIKTDEPPTIGKDAIIIELK